MARIFIDGFETGDTYLWDEASSGDLVGTGNVMTGGFYLNFPQGDKCKLIKSLPTKTEYYFSFSVKPNGDTCESLCSVGLNDVMGISLVRETDDTGVISILSGDDASVTTLGSSSPTRGVFGTKRSDIILHVITRVTGLADISVTVNGKVAINLVNTFIPIISMNQFILGSSSFTNVSTGSFDDVVIDDAEAPIRPKIIGLKPNAVGTYNDFLRSSGNANYECVDEVPGNDSDFVLSNTVSQTDSYNIGSLPTIYTGVNCIQLSARAWYEGNSNVTNMKLLVKTPTTLSVSPTIALSNYPIPNAYLLQTNPDTGLPFTRTEIETLEIGIRTA